MDNSLSLLGMPSRVGRKQFYAIIAFMIILYVSDAILAAVMENLLLASQFRYSKLYAGERSDDVLIIGNSRGVNGFYAPDLSEGLGMNVFNLSFNGLSLEMAEILLNDYIELNNRPRLVVIEVTMIHTEGFNNDILKAYSGVSFRMRDALDGIETNSYFSPSRYLRSSRFSGEFYLRVLYYLNKSDQYWINQYRIDNNFADNFQPTPEMLISWEQELSDKQIRTLRRMVDFASENGFKIKFIITPYLTNYINNVMVFESWLSNINEKCGIEIVDWSKLVDTNESFADPIHTNLVGYLKISKIVESEILKWLMENEYN